MVAQRVEAESETSWVFLGAITADPRCQPRAQIDSAVVAEYAEAMTDGLLFPAVELFWDGTTHWLADGFHRYFAARRSGMQQIEAVVTDGDVWDAIERSCIVNGEHGLRRSNDDKRRAVKAMFAVMEHRGENWSDMEVARRCGVGHTMAKAVRLTIFTKSKDDLAATSATTRLIQRGGRTFEMDTSRIGSWRETPLIESQPMWQPPPTIPEVVATLDPETTDAIVESERRSGVKLVVGETVADCNKRLSLARGELGELVSDLGEDQITDELESDGYLRSRWLQLGSTADAISTLVRGFTERNGA